MYNLSQRPQPLIVLSLAPEAVSMEDFMTKLDLQLNRSMVCV